MSNVRGFPLSSFHFNFRFPALSTFHKTQVICRVICRLYSQGLFAGYSQVILIFAPKETTNEIMRYSLELVLIHAGILVNERNGRFSLVYSVLAVRR